MWSSQDLALNPIQAKENFKKATLYEDNVYPSFLFSINSSLILFNKRDGVREKTEFRRKG
jgi:hypothetical protein